MHAVKGALGILDDHVLKHGTPAMKLQTRQGRAAIDGAEKGNRNNPHPREPQRVSDALLHQARLQLLEVRPHLVIHKQHNVLPHVDRAVNEIHVALKIR
jgi:hypothetical protein